MINDLGEKLKEISEYMTEEKIKNMSNEELVGYLFLVEKVKSKLEEVVDIVAEEEEDKN